MNSSEDMAAQSSKNYFFFQEKNFQEISKFPKKNMFLLKVVGFPQTKHDFEYFFQRFFKLL